MNQQPKAPLRLNLDLPPRAPRPDPTPEQVEARIRRDVLAERIQENLVARKRLFDAAAKADADCVEWERIGDPRCDVEALQYALGSFGSFVPRQLDDDQGRKWHLILDSARNERPREFLLFRELSDSSTDPDPLLLEVLNGRDLANAMPEYAMRAELRRTAYERDEWKDRCLRSERRAEDAPIEIRDRSLALAEKLCVASSTPWGELLAIAGEVTTDAYVARRALEKAGVVEKVWHALGAIGEEALVKHLERWRAERTLQEQQAPSTLSADQVLQLAYALGCERVQMSILGEVMIETAAALKKDAEQSAAQLAAIKADLASRRAEVAVQTARQTVVGAEARIQKLEGWRTRLSSRRPDLADGPVSVVPDVPLCNRTSPGGKTCERRAGHAGEHKDGPVTWFDPPIGRRSY